MRMTRTEEMKLQVTELEHQLIDIQREIDKFIGANKKTTLRFGYKEYLRYYNQHYLEQQIEWYFYDNALDNYEIEVKFENFVCYVELL